VAFSPIDPSRLQGEALDRWYVRSPYEVQQERQAAHTQKYDAFFRRSEPADPPTTLPDRTNQDFSATGRTWRTRGTNRWRDQDQSTYAPAEDPQSGRFQLVAASQPAAAPGIANCPTCHGRVPPLPPFPFSFLPGGPFFRDVPSVPSGGGSQPDPRDKKECDRQLESDTEICGSLRRRDDIAICRATASDRYAHCRRPDGTIGFPHLETRGGRRP